MEVKKWLIISFKHDDLMDGSYGKHLASYEGTYEQAAKEAREYVPAYSPVVVCWVIA